jgi:CSLREA domain-containing protein
MNKGEKILAIILAFSICITSFSFADPTQAATFTVDSTGDSSDASAGDGICDIGDGSCTLRAAIEEANAGSGSDTISIGAIGTTTPASALPMINVATTTISGPGNDGFVIDGVNTTGESGLTIALSVASTTISGLTIKNFDGNGIGFSGSRLTLIDNNHLISNGQAGIGVYQNPSDGLDKNITISNNISEYNGWDGIQSAQVNGVTIKNNTTNHNTQKGIFINTADNQSISGNTSTFNGSAGIQITSSIGNTLTGNTLTSNTGQGVYLDHSTSTTIENNTVNSNTNDGVNLNYATSTTINGNTINSNGNMGINVNNSYSNTVSNNTINNNDAGVIIQNYSDNNTISGNTINNSNTYSGIYIHLFSNGTVISNNNISGSASGYDCIQLLGTENTQVTGNTLANCNQDGISIHQNVAYGAGLNNDISGNTITSVGRHGIYVGESGNIYDTNITGNTISTSANDGIKILNAASTTVSSNTLHSNYNYGINLNTSGDNRIFSNTIYSNGSVGSYQAMPIYITYNSLPYESGDGPAGGVHYLVDSDHHTVVSVNGTAITGSDGTQDIYLALVTDNPADPANASYYTFYTDKSQANFLTWCQANVNANCNVDYYSTGVPIWQSNGAGHNYTWNAAALPPGGTVNTSYYTSSALLVNYLGNDYSQTPFGPGIEAAFYSAGNPLTDGIMNFLGNGLNDVAFGYDGVTNLDLVLMDDGGAVFGKAGWVVPHGLNVIAIYQAYAGITPTEVCRESDVFTANGDANDYTFKPLASWGGCAGATMIAGYANPVTMVGHSVNPPAFNTGVYSYSAIYLSGATSTTMTSNTIYDNGNGIIFAGASDGNTVNEGTITDSLGYDIKSSASGTNILDNLSFDYTKTNITAGQIDVYFDVRARARDASSDPLLGATASLLDANSNTTALGLTGAGGYTGYTSINAFNLNSSGYQTNNNPYTLTVTESGYETGNTIATVNSQNQTITLDLSLTCTSFTYSDWGSCASNSLQTRTILASSPTGCSGGAPVLSQSCTYVASGGGSVISLPTSLGSGNNDVVATTIGGVVNVGVITISGTNVLTYATNQNNFSTPESGSGWQLGNHNFIISTLDLYNYIATIIISSDPQTIILKKGESKDVDLDGDKTNDVKLTFVNTYSNRAEITLTSLAGSVVVTPAPPTTPPAEFVFQKDLYSGMIDSDVLELQKCLNANGFILTASGAGSPGNETTKFGQLTREALIRFQKANNLNPADGYFGLATRNSLHCAKTEAASTTTSPTGAGTFAYGRARLGSLETEQNLAKTLASYLQNAFGKAAYDKIFWSAGNPKQWWYGYVNAYVYGGYLLEEIRQSVKFSGKTVHPTFPAPLWRTSADYKAYINK